VAKTFWGEWKYGNKIYWIKLWASSWRFHVYHAKTCSVLHKGQQTPRNLLQDYGTLEDCTAYDVVPALRKKCCWFNMLTFAYSFCDGYYKYLKIFGQMFSSQLSIFWWSVPTCGKFGDNWLKYLVQMFPEICTICGVNDFLSSFGFEVVGNEFANVCSNICWSMPQFVMRCLIIWKYLVMNLFNYFFTITLFWWEMHIFANIWLFICQYLVKYLFQYFKDNVYFLSLFLRITSHFWRLFITITLLLRLFDNLKILRLFNGIGLFQKHNLKGSF